MPHSLVIADDITGANDIGIMYAKSGQQVLVYGWSEEKGNSYKDCDILILDTDSRFNQPEQAYEKVYTLTRRFRDAGIQQFFNKQCSVFRGNIGAEFDAMLDALEENFAIVVLGFPDNGRKTIESLHYVHGELLENSQFKNDPVHPMHCSDLREILKKQTKRRVGAIHWQIYEKGETKLREAIEKERALGGYCIMDVRDKEDLKLLAKLLQSEKILCGSSALAEYLAEKQSAVERAKTEIKSNKVFCVCGSLTPQTLKQIEYIRGKGYPVYEMDSMQLLDEFSRQREIDCLITGLMNEINAGGFALLHSSNQSEKVEKTKQTAKAQGMDNIGISRLISKSLAEITKELVQKCDINRILVCGGDTSSAVCASLKIRGMRVLQEVEKGLPICQSVDFPYYKILLKSGSFGSTSFIEKAISALCEDCN